MKSGICYKSLHLKDLYYKLWQRGLTDERKISKEHKKVIPDEHEPDGRSAVTPGK